MTSEKYMDIEKKLNDIGEILLDAYQNDDNLTSFILIASAYNDGYVSYDIQGSKFSVLALVNRIIAELSEQWCMSTDKILLLLAKGQQEYDEFLERKKKDE